jgi:hypothetical protein
VLPRRISCLCGNELSVSFGRLNDFISLFALVDTAYDFFKKVSFEKIYESYREKKVTSLILGTKTGVNVSIL